VSPSQVTTLVWWRFYTGSCSRARVFASCDPWATRPPSNCSRSAGGSEVERRPLTVWRDHEAGYLVGSTRRLSLNRLKYSSCDHQGDLNDLTRVPRSRSAGRRAPPETSCPER